MPLTVEDRVAIADLYARNAWALDVGDADGFVATFAESATLRMRATYDGHEGIRRFVDQFRERDFGFPRAQHLVSQLVIESGAEGRCRSRAYVTRVHRLPGQHRGNCHVMWTGYSSDTCVKVDGCWLFEARALHAWEGDVAEVLAAEGAS
jgi:hypothetical protein